VLGICMFTWWLQRKGLLTCLMLDVTVFHNLKFFDKLYCYKKVIKNAYATRTVLRVIRKRQGERKAKVGNLCRTLVKCALSSLSDIVDGWIDRLVHHLTTSMRVMYRRILEECSVRVISQNKGCRSGRGILWMVLSPLRHHEYINFKWEQMD
jgi:hypothetical protein